MKNILFMLLTLSLLSCETLVDDLPLSRFPELKSKLVLTSFISTIDTVISVKLTQSVPLFGEYPKPKIEKVLGFNGDSITVVNYNEDNVVADAQVVLANGQNSIIIPYNKVTRQYDMAANKFPIVAGKTYTLTAKTKDLFIETSTTVPFEIIKIENIKIDSTFEKVTIWEANGAGQGQPVDKLLKVINVDFDWIDIPKVNNYYKVEAFIENKIEFPLLEKKEITYRPTFNKNFANWDGKNYAPKKKYVTDENLDGKSIFSPKGKIRIYPQNRNNGLTFEGKFYPIKEQDFKTLTVKLLNVNKDFYQNQISLETFSASDGNPFSEPVQVYSNIKNGLGCFGAYNISTKKVTFK
jgi:Domain of unknown function (DUF4249)